MIFRVHINSIELNLKNDECGTGQATNEDPGRAQIFVQYTTLSTDGSSLLFSGLKGDRR